MRNSECITISLEPTYMKALKNKADKAGLPISKVISFMISHLNDHDLKRDGLFWTFEPPAWREKE